VSDKPGQTEPPPEEFAAGALKVDPKGLPGRHREKAANLLTPPNRHEPVDNPPEMDMMCVS
jgi:hypothetical protein